MANTYSIYYIPHTVLLYITQSFNEIGTIIIPTLQIRKLRHREIK